MINKNNIILIIFSTIINIFITIILINILSNNKKIAVLDLQTIKDEYIQHIINDKNYEEKIRKFTINTTNLIYNVSKDNNIIIVPKQVVYSGEDLDITQQFKEILLYEN